jgi:hypothetical protein
MKEIDNLEVIKIFVISLYFQTLFALFAECSNFFKRSFADFFRSNITSFTASNKCTKTLRMLLKPGMGNEEWGMEEWGMRNV